MRKLILVLVFVALVVALVWWMLGGSRAMNFGAFNVNIVRPSTLQPETPYTGSPLTKEYKNSTLKFSLSMPEDFNAQELPVDESGGQPIILQNSKGEGIQIYVTPNQGDMRELSANDVRSSIPDMQVASEETVEIGSDFKGIAFKSDNDAFGGESREVWFYFRGSLYQISTYARLDPLLKAMFATWKFF